MSVDVSVGERFTRLVVIGDHLGGGLVPVRCDCGVEKVVRRASLRCGDTKSCGCWGRERHATRGNLRHGHIVAGRASRTYITWKNMRQRCLNPNHPKYPHYGGRGVSICAEWLDSFAAFLADMGERPAGLTLDRIDVDGDYCPDNCRWATALQQVTNRRPLDKDGRRTGRTDGA